MSAATEPSWAERARTALAEATVASLITVGEAPERTVTAVGVHDPGDGRPLVWLQPAAPSVARLADCPVATVSVPGPSPFRLLHLTGALKACPSERPGLRAYRMAVASVHLVGAHRAPVPPGEFFAAEPDPLRHQARRILTHLEAAHADDLLACVQAHGHEAVAVVPRALDRYGIELAALNRDGLTLLRLGFPEGQVDALDAVRPAVRLPMTCRCRS